MSFSMIALIKRLTISLLALLLAGTGLVWSGDSAGASPACGLTIEIVAAPFAVTDSNNPGAEGPRAATLAAHITNTSGAALTNVQVYMGDGATPGRFPESGGGALALLDANDAAHRLGALGPGESATAYWPVTYPPTFDVSYSYVVWATSSEGCSASRSSQITTQSEISATANKLLPTGAMLLVSPQQPAPGSLVQVRISGFTLGTIGQGPKPLAPYDAWLQPVGNLDFDPTCLRLVRSEVLLNSVQAEPFVDQLYFSGLRSYSAQPGDYVEYTFLALHACAATIQPYQQAASGTQEKYNGDFSAASSRIEIAAQGDAALDLSLTSSTPTAGAGETVQLSASFSTGEGAVGYPENGSPVVITAAIPADSSYTAASASSATAASIEYSVDGGQSWSSFEPSDPASVTHLRWLLDESVTQAVESVSYSITLDGDYDGAPLTATATGSLLNAAPLTSDSAVINGVDPAPTPTPTPEPTPAPAQVQSGSEGGLESGPIDGEPSDFLGGLGAATSRAQNSPEPAHKGRLLARMSLSLDNLMPRSGPAGTSPKPAVPVDVLAITNAPDAQAVDFVDGGGQVKAVALGILSLDAPYEHDYGVCNRFKEYTLESIVPEAIDGRWYWRAVSTKGAEIREEAFTFHIFVDEANRRFHVDSRWVQDSYPDNFDFSYDYVFNMQVWSGDAENSRALVRSILTTLVGMDDGGWQVIHHNEEQPVAPQVYIRSATFQADQILLTIDNRSQTRQSVRLYGSWRSYMDRKTSTPFDNTLALPSGVSRLTLAFPALLDVTLYVENNGFSDKIYAGGGLWFAFPAEQEATTQLTPGECRDISHVDSLDLLLAGCVTLVSNDAGQPDNAGLGRTLNPNGRPVDVSPYRALRFWAKGDGGPVRVVLETAGVSDGDYHQMVFTPDNTWRQYILGLDQFQQRGFGALVALTGKDVVAVVWMNGSGSAQPFTLAVDGVSFTNAGLLALKSLPADGPDTAPRPVSVAAPEGAQMTSVILHYSADGGRTFTPLAMTAQLDGYRGEIPGHGLGSDLLYYVEATSANGYISRLPADAPASLMRYRVDDRTGLLVDDFAGERLRNRLGGDAGLFHNEEAGGAIQVYRSDRRLSLTYSVPVEGQFAGYFTRLGNLDLTGYSALSLRVRGVQGGEQLLVGLRDSSGHEPKVSVGALLSGGISQEWRWVQIPLSTFGPALQLGAVESLSLSFANGQETGYSAGQGTGDGVGDVAGQGTVQVDEIRLGSPPMPLIVGAFDDGLAQRNAQGLASWTSAPGGSLDVRALPVEDAWAQGFAPAGYALAMDYQVNEGGYALWHTELNGSGGGGVLSLWVKGGGDLTPNLYLTDGMARARVSLADYTSQDEGWQFVSIPLSAFVGLNPARLTGFEVAFEFGQGSGRFWLDAVAIGQPGRVAVDQRVVYLRDAGSGLLAMGASGGGEWQARSDSGWLRVQARGYGPGHLRLWSESAGLAPGSYTGRVVLQQAGGPTEEVTVHLTVTTATVAPRLLFLPAVQR